MKPHGGARVCATQQEKRETCSMSGEMDCSKRRCCRCRKHQMSYSYTRVMGAEVGKGLQKAGAHVPGHRRRSRICQSSTGRQSCRCLYPLGSSVRTGTPSSALIGSHNQPQADSLVCLETINALSRATYRGTANIEHAKAAAACVGRIARAQVRYTGLMHTQSEDASISPPLLPV